jgi:hypothetical protein
MIVVTRYLPYVTGGIVKNITYMSSRSNIKNRAVVVGGLVWAGCEVRVAWYCAVEHYQQDIISC